MLVDKTLNELQKKKHDLLKQYDKTKSEITKSLLRLVESKIKKRQQECMN